MITAQGFFDTKGFVVGWKNDGQGWWWWRWWIDNIIQIHGTIILVVGRMQHYAAQWQRRPFRFMEELHAGDRECCFASLTAAIEEEEKEYASSEAGKKRQLGSIGRCAAAAAA